MPTFNQLVRKGRQVLATKSTAPALLKTYNSQKKQYSDLNSPQKRGVCNLNWLWHNGHQPMPKLHWDFLKLLGI